MSCAYSFFQNLATAQLINNRRPSEDTSIAPESPTLSSNDHSPEKPIQIATALRVSRPNAPFTSTTSALQVTDFPGRSTAVPKLVKRDSIGDEDSRGVVTSSPGWRKRVKAPDSGMGSEASVFSAAWIEVEDSAILQVTFIC